jgi:hypothetical protein
VHRLTPPRPSFAVDMSEAEAGIMAQHFGYWQSLLEDGVAVVCGPVADPTGVWGMAVVESEGEQDVRERRRSG